MTVESRQKQEENSKDLYLKERKKILKARKKKNGAFHTTEE